MVLVLTERLRKLNAFLCLKNLANTWYLGENFINFNFIEFMFKWVN
jgi:hypothetical protein